MKSYLLSLLSLCLVSLIGAQDLSVPDSIRKELKTEVLTGGNGDTMTFMVRYPDGYDPKKKYPVLLGLSGGGQSAPVVAYCYAVWFRSALFSEYLTIMPVNEKVGSLRDIDEEAISDILEKIKQRFNVQKKGWLIAGTSNGGVAAFNFVGVAPKLFNGLVVVPGAMSDAIVLSKAWKHLVVVLAYGAEDAEDWIKASSASKNRLEGRVRRVEVLPLPGQGHMLPMGYDIDQVYRHYFTE